MLSAAVGRNQTNGKMATKNARRHKKDVFHFSCLFVLLVAIKECVAREVRSDA